MPIERTAEMHGYIVSASGTLYKLSARGQEASRNFKVVHPASGCGHQVNADSLRVACSPARRMGNTYRTYPDTLVGHYAINTTRT